MTESLFRASKRCAIYTRKSKNSRLDHEVNSLTIQHEICSAYIASQTFRGWTDHAQRRPITVGPLSSGWAAIAAIKTRSWRTPFPTPLVAVQAP